LADRLSKQMGQSVVVENRPGSGTLVGTDAAAKAAPDGYTLLMGSVSNIVLNMGLYKNLPYDSLRDFEPVGLAVSYSYTLVGRKDLPFNSLKDVVAVVGQVFVQAHVEHDVGYRTHKQGVAVRRSLGSCISTDQSTRAWAVFNHHALAHLLTQSISQQTRHGIKAAAWGLRHDDAQGFSREALGPSPA